MIIKNFNSKKLVEYLKDGQKNCIKFIHGLGDTIMFYPIFESLKNLYPKIEWTLYTTCGQEKIFGEFSCEEKDYDFIFELYFPCCEFDEKLKKYTKAELCCLVEIGIPYPQKDEFKINFSGIKSPLIGVHFCSTSCPSQTGCNYDFARKIWYSVKEAGLIPIETHFIHKFHNKVNQKYDFIDKDCRGETGGINALIGLLKSCSGFIGVASGPFCVAMTLYPEKVIFLENKSNYKLFMHNHNVLSMNVNKQFNGITFQDWLSKVK